MKRLLIGILALAALATGAVQAASPPKLYFVLGGDPEQPAWCLYRSQKAWDVARQADDAYDQGEVSRIGGVVTAVWSHITPSGDWMVTDHYRFGSDGRGSLMRNGGSATSGTILDAAYRWGPDRKVVRTTFMIRDSEPPHRPAKDFYPNDLAVVTRPQGLDIWPLVAAIDGQPGKAKVCRRA